MDFGIAGKNALVTGGSMGIGRAAAASLVAAGVNVAVVARDKARLTEAAAALRGEGGTVVTISADTSNAGDIARMAEEALQALGPIDILVNNAGGAQAGNLTVTTDESWMRSIDTKLLGYVRCARAFVPGMAARGWGRVVNVIGVAAHQSNPAYLSGGAINAALLSVTKSLAKEFATSGVTVNAVNPGPIATARRQRLMQERAKMSGRTLEQEDKASVAGVPMGRAGTPEEIGAMIAFLCSQQAAFTSGALIDIDGAMSLGL